MKERMNEHTFGIQGGHVGEEEGGCSQQCAMRLKNRFCGREFEKRKNMRLWAERVVSKF